MAGARVAVIESRVVRWRGVFRGSLLQRRVRVGLGCRGVGRSRRRHTTGLGVRVLVTVPQAHQTMVPSGRPITGVAGQVGLGCRGVGRSRRRHTTGLGVRVLVTVPQAHPTGPGLHGATWTFPVPRVDRGAWARPAGDSSEMVAPDRWAANTGPVVQRVVQSRCAPRHRTGSGDLLVARLDRKGFR